MIKKFELQEDLSKMITNKNYKVDLVNLSDKKGQILPKKYFDERAPGNKSTRERSLIRLLKLPSCHLILMNLVKN